MFHVHRFRLCFRDCPREGFAAAARLSTDAPKSSTRATGSSHLTALLNEDAESCEGTYSNDNVEHGDVRNAGLPHFRCSECIAVMDSRSSSSSRRVSSAWTLFDSCSRPEISCNQKTQTKTCIRRNLQHRRLYVRMPMELTEKLGFLRKLPQGGVVIRAVE